MKTRTALLGALAALALPAASAPADVLQVIDFDDLAHGEIVSTQYVGAHGLTISAHNPNRDFDLAVAFDTTLMGTRDPDLEDPWDSGNLAPNTNLGRALILQENDYRTGDGIANRPDDEGSRPAGSITFSWNQTLTGIGFDILDLEAPDVEMTSLKLYLDGALVADIDFEVFVTPGDLYDPSVDFGNNSANRIGIISAQDLGIAGFDTAKFKLGGSMAIDTVKVVPTPGALTLAGLGGLCVARRRRR